MVKYPKWALVAAVETILVLLLLAGVWGSSGRNAAPAFPGTAGPGEPDEPRRHKSTLEPERSDLLTEKPREQLSLQDLATSLSLRVIDAHSGQPVVKALVSITSVENQHIEARGETSVDGVFTERVDPILKLVNIKVEADGYVPLCGSKVSISNRPTNLGTVSLERSGEIQGRVEGYRSELAPGVALVAERIALDFSKVAGRASTQWGSPLAYDTAIEFQSDELGTFHLMDVTTGEWLIRSRSPIAPSAEQVISVRANQVAHPLIRLGDMNYMFSGIVVTEDGIPVEGAYVNLSDKSSRAPFARTGKGGRFWFSSKETQRTNTEFTLSLTDFHGIAGISGASHPEHNYHWGSHGVFVSASTRESIVIRVTDKQEGVPVQGFNVRIVLIGAQSPNHNRIYTANESDGTAICGDVPPGDCLIFIEPHDITYGSPQPRRITASSAGGEECEFSLSRRCERQIVLKTTSGKPVPSCVVEVLAPLNTSAGKVMLTTKAKRPKTMRIRGRWIPAAYILDEGVTDAAGRLLISGEPMTDLAIMVKGPGCVPIVVPHVNLEAGQTPLEVIVNAGSSIEGRLLVGDDSMSPQDFSKVRIQLIPSGEGIRIASSRPAKDGKFVLDGLRKGKWLIRVRHAYGRHDAGTVQISEGESVTKLDIDARWLITGTVTGTIAVDGEPLKFGAMVLASSTSSRLVYRTDAHGKFRAIAPLGSYALRIVKPSSNNSKQWFDMSELIIIDRATRHGVNINLITDSVEIRIADNNGHPVTKGHCTLNVQRRNGVYMKYRPSDEGVIRIEPRPIGSFSVWYHYTNSSEGIKLGDVPSSLDPEPRIEFLRPSK